VFRFIHQNSGQDHNVLIADKSFENVAMFKYLGTTIRIKIAFTKTLRTDPIQGMLDTILFRFSCLPFCFLKAYNVDGQDVTAEFVTVHYSNISSFIMSVRGRFLYAIIKHRKQLRICYLQFSSFKLLLICLYNCCLCFLLFCFTANECSPELSDF